MSSKIRLLQDQLLVRLVDQRYEGKLVFLSKERWHETLIGKVEQVGPGAYLEGKNIRKRMDVGVGDYVAFHKYFGSTADTKAVHEVLYTEYGKDVALLRERDVLFVLTDNLPLLD